MGHFDDDRKYVTIIGTPDTVRALCAGLKDMYGRAGDGLDARESVMVERLVADLGEALALDGVHQKVELLRKGRTYTDNVSRDCEVHPDVPGPGWIYPGDLVIEEDPTGMYEATMILDRTRHVGPRAELEHKLAEFALMEGL